MEQINHAPMEYLDRWFANIVDTINDAFTQLNAKVATANLTTLDTPPIEYMEQWLNELTDNLNTSFKTIDSRLSSIEARLAMIRS